MKVTAVVGRIENYPDYRIDALNLQSDELTKRVFRKRTSSGMEIKATFPRGTILRPGDVLTVDVEERYAIVVSVLPEYVLVIQPENFKDAVEAAHQLGNRHIPIQIGEADIVAPYNPMLERFFNSIGIRCKRDERVLEKPFLHVFAPHLHGV